MIPQNLLALSWVEDKLVLLDQRKLPRLTEFYTCKNIEDCNHAIKSMIVRGAPLIGFTAIFGLALWLKDHPQASFDQLQKVAFEFAQVRPTAINLRYEIENTLQWVKNDFSSQELWKKVAAFGLEQIKSLETKNKMMALAAEEILNQFKSGPYRLMTLCNTGYLACGTLGTALGVVTYLAEQNKISHVYASETRPYLQGLRLTAYELKTLKIPHSVVVEGAASYLMREKMVDAIFVGADRIVRNGDTANKIGTATLAAVAKYYEVPFFVVAPLSSFDFSLDSGKQIPIELRDPDEILSWKGERIAAQNVNAFNPSFDITDAKLITGIICEKGCISPVTLENLTKICRE